MDLLSSLKNLKNSFGIFGAGVSGSGSVLGIDIGSSSVKLVQVRKQKGRAVLETYSEVAIGPYVGKNIGEVAKVNEQTLSQILQDLFKESNTTTNVAGISVPFASSLTLVIKMPRLSDSEINAMVPNEARKYIPMKIEEVFLDWMILPDKGDSPDWIRDYAQSGKGKKDYREVLLVAIHNSALGFLQQTMKQAGVKPLFYELEAFSIMRSSVENSLSSIGVVDFGASGTKVYVVKQGILKLSHLINHSSVGITNVIERTLNVDFKTAEHIKKQIGLSPAENMVFIDKESIKQAQTAITTSYSRIFSEINKTFLEYEKKYNEDIEKVYFTGGGAQTKGLKEFAKQKLPMEVVMVDPFSLLEYPEFLNDITKQIGAEFAISIGLAMRALKGK